jgi:hypothetical protein
MKKTPVRVKVAPPGQVHRDKTKYYRKKKHRKGEA